MSLMMKSAAAAGVVQPFAIDMANAAPIESPIDDPTISLAAELDAACDRHFEATEALWTAENKLREWDNLNPFPKLGDWSEGDREGERRAVTEYEAALVGRGQARAPLKASVDEAAAIEGRLATEVERLAVALRDAAPATQIGLKAKALSALRNADDELACSVIENMLNAA